MPESSVYPSIVRLPPPPQRAQSRFQDPAKLADEDLRRIYEWSNNLSRALAKQFNDISQPLREGKITPGSHASSHAPQTGIDPLATAAPTGGYGTSAAAGIADSLMRSDARLEYPEAIATVADRTKRGTLTDDATFGALVDFSAGTAFAVTNLALKAPGATNPISIGKWGNIAVAGLVADDNILMRFAKSDFNTSSQVFAMSGSIRQQGTGLCTGLSVGALMGPLSANTNRLIGIDLVTTQSTANATGDNICMALLYGSNVSATRGDMKGLRVNAGPFIGTISNHYGIQMQKPAANLWGTISGTNYWIKGEALSGGANSRIYCSFDGATTGSPTKVVTFEALAHTVGTTRRSGEFGNSLDMAKDTIYSVAGFGPIFKDTQGTPEFWRAYVSATGLKDATYSMDDTEAVTTTRGASATGVVTLNIQDVGTAAPAV